MQEFRRIEQTCLFIRYSVLGRHKIICAFKFVILFLITLAYKGQEIMFCQRQDRRGDEIQSIFHITFIHVLTFHSELTKEHNKMGL